MCGKMYTASFALSKMLRRKNPYVVLLSIAKSWLNSNELVNALIKVVISRF